MAKINLGKVKGDKGTSLRNRGTWNRTAEYVNDQQNIDMVSHNGSLWTCTETNTNSEPANNNAKWALAAKGFDNGADISTAVVNFTQAGSRENINTGDTVATAFGKMKKWFYDFGTSAFYGVSNALTQTSAGYVLDARQGKVLSDKTNQLNTTVNSHTSSISTINNTLDKQSTRVSDYVMINKDFSGQMTQTCNYPAKDMQRNSATGQYSVRVTFPVTFAAEPFVFTTVRYDSGYEPCWVSQITSHGFVLHCGTNLSEFYVQWFAVGRWK